MKKTIYGGLCLALLLTMAISQLGCGVGLSSRGDHATAQEGQTQCAAVGQTSSLILSQVLLEKSFLREGLRALLQVYRPELAISAGDCPVLTIDPPITSLFSIPPNLNIILDYGGGCSPSPGMTMSGSLVAALSNINFSSTEISANFVITANNLIQNGLALANGSANGWLRATAGAGDTLNVTAEANFTNFALVGLMANGRLTAEATNIDINTYDLNTITVTLHDFSLQGLLTANDCVMSVTSQAGAYHVVISGDTSQGPLNLEADLTLPSDGVFVINTTSTGSLAGYAVSINGLTMDINQCQSNPISGSITITGDGNTYGKTFTGACDGNWGIGGLVPGT